MRGLKQALAVAAISLVAFATFGASPAQAHTIVVRTTAGCLLQAHHNSIGALNANSGTCDRDNFWVGRVFDNHATNDGHCVTAILDGIRMADSCNASGNGFTFLDPQRNSSAFTRLCWTNLGACLQGPNTGF